MFMLLILISKENNCIEIFIEINELKFFVSGLSLNLTTLYRAYPCYLGFQDNKYISLVKGSTRLKLSKG